LERAIAARAGFSILSLRSIRKNGVLKKHRIWGVLVLANAVSLFCLVNPWVSNWQAFRESLHASVDALMSALTGWV
jgi:hypothetical protein